MRPVRNDSAGAAIFPPSAPGPTYWILARFAFLAKPAHPLRAASAENFGRWFFSRSPRYNLSMRKLIFALAFLVLALLALGALGLPLRAQQTAPALPSPRASAAQPQSTAGTVHENIVYGTANGETLLLDIFEPSGNNDHPRPAVILIHGGGWTSFDKSTMRSLAQFLARSGFIAVAADYRLFHDNVNRWPAQLDDVQRSVRWLRANAAKYNIAPEHIGAYGHSAGAQLAALLGMLDTRDNSDPALAKYSSKVQAVVDSSGPTEFAPARKDSDEDKFLSSFFGAGYSAHPEIWRDASPVDHVSKSNAPFLIIHGTRDEMVSIAQAQALYDKLKEAGAAVQFVRLDSDHMFHEPAARRQLAVETQLFFEHYLVPAS
jgi:acetyl esterase/lipase